MKKMILVLLAVVSINSHASQKCPRVCPPWDKDPCCIHSLSK